ncbi:MAG TPA: phosphatase PAP2 family protein [Geomonas sp.]|nr:phosphatase PAP2 family protein [Geomonas sp.]
MIMKLTAGVVMLTTTLFTIPAYAESAPAAAVPVTVTLQTAAPAASGLPTASDLQSPGNVESTTAENDFQSAAKDQAATTGANRSVLTPSTGSASPDIDRLNIPYLKSVVSDTGRILTSPIRWDKKDWLKVGLVLGVTGTLFLVDQKVKDFAQDHQNHVASGFASIGNDLGNGLYTLPAVGAFYVYGALGDDHKARKTSLMALESFAISGLLTEGIKALGGRHRPNTGDRPLTFDGPDYMKNVSFSSGHTASAFSIATVFANQYQDHPWVPYVAYSLAALTGLSRIYSNEHWASDVFFGGALGYFTSKAILKFHQDDKDKILGKRLMILPQVGHDMTGVKVKYEF